MPTPRGLPTVADLPPLTDRLTSNAQARRDNLRRALGCHDPVVIVLDESVAPTDAVIVPFLPLSGLDAVAVDVARREQPRWLAFDVQGWELEALDASVDEGLLDGAVGVELDVALATTSVGSPMLETVLERLSPYCLAAVDTVHAKPHAGRVMIARAVFVQPRT